MKTYDPRTDATRTKAVLGGLQLVRSHGGTLARSGNGSVSNHAIVVGYAYRLDSETVQQEFDAYIANQRALGY